MSPEKGNRRKNCRYDSREGGEADGKENTAPSSPRLGFKMVGLLLPLPDRNCRAATATLSKWRTQEGEKPLDLIVSICCRRDADIHSVLLYQDLNA